MALLPLPSLSAKATTTSPGPPPAFAGVFNKVGGLCRKGADGGRHYLSAMTRPILGSLMVFLLMPACRKEQVKQYAVDLRATCYDCVVQYASGAERGRFDTLSGVVAGLDTLRETGTYTLTMTEDEDLFFRACRLAPDSGRFGDIELVVEGDVHPLGAVVDRNTNCAVINQAVQFR